MPSTIPAIKDDKLLKASEVAAILRVDLQTVYTLIKEGSIPTIRFFSNKNPKGRGSAISILQSDLNEFISSHREFISSHREVL